MWHFTQKIFRPRSEKLRTQLRRTISASKSKHSLHSSVAFEIVSGHNHVGHLPSNEGFIEATSIFIGELSDQHARLSPDATRHDAKGPAW